MFALKFILVVVVISHSVISGNALIAYDCGGEHINKTTISLVETPSCRLAEHNITEVTTNVAVTQSTINVDLPFVRCLVIAYHHIWRCGASIDTNAPGGNYAEVISVTREECKRMIEDRVYETNHGNHVFITLRKGGRMSFSYTSWGSIQSNGGCKEGPTLYANGREYDRHTRNTRLEMWYVPGTARLNVEDKIVMMPNGMRCDVTAEYCELADYGQVYWKVPVPPCTSEAGEQSIIYKGQGTLVTNHETEERFVQVEFSGHYFQIKLEKKTVGVCGYRSYYTEHPKLFVTLLDSAYPDFPLKPVSGADVNMLNYINSKLVYSLRHTKEQVEKLFKLFEHERCLMQNRITSNLLTLAILSPREFAYQYFGEPGYTAVVRGEVVHVARCRPVPVVPSPSNLCYNELPVLYNNQTRYMTPRTRILMKIGTIIDCSPDLGPQYRLESRWISMVSTGLISVAKPHIITPEPLSYTFENMDQLATGGLYTSETILKYQKILTSPLEEHVITSRMTSAIRGDSKLPGGYMISNGFSLEDFNQIENHIKGWFERMLDVLLAAGGWYGAFLLLCTVYSLLMNLCNCGVNYFVIRPHTSRVFAILTCCFSSLVHAVASGRVRGTIKKQKQNKIEESAITIQPSSSVHFNMVEDEEC